MSQNKWQTTTTQAVLTQGSLILNSSSRLYFYCRLKLGHIFETHFDDTESRPVTNKQQSEKIS